MKRQLQYWKASSCSMEADGDDAGKLQQFMLVTGTDAGAAREVLQGSGWNVDAAVDFFFATGCSLWM